MTVRREIGYRLFLLVMMGWATVFILVFFVPPRSWGDLAYCGFALFTGREAYGHARAVRTLRVRLLQDRRARENRCSECGYILKGNVSGTCPECGTAVERAKRNVDDPKT